LAGPRLQDREQKLAQCLLESSSPGHSGENVASVLENTAVSIMTVQFFTHRLADVDLVFILQLELLMSVFDSISMTIKQSHPPMHD